MTTNDLQKALQEDGFEAFVSKLADACREIADTVLARYDDAATADWWELRAKALEDLQEGK